MQTYLLGDLHLRSSGDPAASKALARLLDEAPDAPFVFVGDTLDLAAEGNDARAAIASSLASHPEISRRIAQRAARGVRTTFIAGNHDAAIPRELDALHNALGLTGADRAQVLGEPWFMPLANGAVHVEHGHIYDPDGSFGHPLGPLSDDVGIAVLRRFILPIDGHELISGNEELPFKMLMRVVRRWGPRAPLVVARYMTSALSIVLDAGPREAPASEIIRKFSGERGVDRETIELLAGAHATPTITNATATFFRLYLDRIGAVTALVGGAATAIVSPPIGASIATMGALVLLGSILTQSNRYRGRAEQALAEGAARAAEIVGARTTILGHVHVDASGPHYRNTASFAYSRTSEGHPYLRVDENGEISRGFAL